LLAAIALMLPSAVVRWSRGAAYHPSWAWIDVFFAAVTGAAVGWFIASLVSWLLTPLHFVWRWPVFVTVCVALAGALAGCALAGYRRKKLLKSA
jgi:hypothetical protein